MIRANWFTCFEEHVVESSYKGFLIRSELELNYRFLPWNLIEMYNRIAGYTEICCILHLW